MRDALGDLVDRPISARRDHELRAAPDMFPGNRAGRLGTSRRGDGYIVPLLFEDLNRALDQRAATPSELPRIGVVNQNGVFIGWDVNSPKFLVKL
jgi:hypothetical protein